MHMIAEFREPVRQIPAVARVEPHILAVLVNLQTPAIELDLVHPAGSHRRSVAENRAAGRNEARHTGHVGSRNRVSKAAQEAAKPHKEMSGARGRTALKMSGEEGSSPVMDEPGGGSSGVPEERPTHSFVPERRACLVENL